MASCASRKWNSSLWVPVHKAQQHWLYNFLIKSMRMPFLETHLVVFLQIRRVVLKLFWVSLSNTWGQFVSSIESSSSRLPNYSPNKSIILGPLLKGAQLFKHGTNNVWEKHNNYAHVFISAEVGRQDLELCHLNSICDRKRANSINWKNTSVEWRCSYLRSDLHERAHLSLYAIWKYQWSLIN